MTASSIRDQNLLEERVTTLMDRLVKDLDLGWLRVTNKFDPCNLDTDRVLCETKADWEYRSATLLWNLHQVASTPDEYLEATAIHELVHALNSPIWESLTGPQQEKLQPLNELATENVARVIHHLLESRG